MYFYLCPHFSNKLTLSIPVQTLKLSAHTQKTLNKTTPKKKIIMKLSASHLFILTFFIVFQSSQFQEHQKKVTIQYRNFFRYLSRCCISLLVSLIWNHFLPLVHLCVFESLLILFILMISYQISHQHLNSFWWVLIFFIAFDLFVVHVTSLCLSPFLSGGNLIFGKVLLNFFPNLWLNILYTFCMKSSILLKSLPFSLLCVFLLL